MVEQYNFDVQMLDRSQQRRMPQIEINSYSVIVVYNIISWILIEINMKKEWKRIVIQRELLNKLSS
jgi:hypothetical protein